MRIYVIGDCRRVCCGFPLILQPDQPLSEAVAAVHRAFMRSQDEDSLPIFVLKPGELRVAALTARVEAARQVVFADRRHTQAVNRVILVVLPVDERHIVACDPHRILGQNIVHPLFFLHGKHPVLAKLSGGCDVFLQMFFPCHAIPPQICCLFL